jgi:hypothetical protein
MANTELADDIRLYGITYEPTRRKLHEDYEPRN